MTSKRNIKMYLKQKSTITAFSFLLVFVVMLIISLLPIFEHRKGVYDEFKTYEITYIGGNDYNVTYIASKNKLFYSQNKKQTTSLNNFAGITDLSNQYGDPVAHYYNFIQIKHEFNSEIKEVKGIMDQPDGTKGETLILTKDNKLYLISQRSNKVQLILDNVKQYEVKYEPTLQKEIYLILHTNNDLSLYYIETNQLIKTNLLNEEIKEFYYVKNENGIHHLLINQNNKVYSMYYQISINNENTFKNSLSYPIFDSNDIFTLNRKDLNINCDKLVEINEKYYYLNNKKVYKINFTSENIQIGCDKNIDDFYATGEDALIAICGEESYYYGDLKDFNPNYNSFTSIGKLKGKIYGNSNSVMLFKDNGRVFIYQDNEFIGMYENIFITIVVRYFSIFAVAITLLYVILSFIEDNKRFNRYFKHLNK